MHTTPPIIALPDLSRSVRMNESTFKNDALAQPAVALTQTTESLIQLPDQSR